MQIHLISHSLVAAGGPRGRKGRGNFPLASDIVWRMYLLSNYNNTQKGGTDEKTSGDRTLFVVIQPHELQSSVPTCIKL